MPIKKWEYRSITGITTARMDKLGVEGWEFVAISTAYGIETAYFKREVIE